MVRTDIESFVVHAPSLSTSSDIIFTLCSFEILQVQDTSKTFAFTWAFDTIISFCKENQVFLLDSSGRVLFRHLLLFTFVLKAFTVSDSSPLPFSLMQT